MTVVNLTPHVITILREEENGIIAGSVGFGRSARQAQFCFVAELPSAGVARVAMHKTAVDLVLIGDEAILVERTTHGEVEGLPAPASETMYVVSLIVARATLDSGRTTDDLLVVGEAVRGMDGQVIGCTSFGRP